MNVSFQNLSLLCARVSQCWPRGHSGPDDSQSWGCPVRHFWPSPPRCQRHTYTRNRDNQKRLRTLGKGGTLSSLGNHGGRVLDTSKCGDWQLRGSCEGRAVEFTSEGGWPKAVSRWEGNRAKPRTAYPAEATPVNTWVSSTGCSRSHSSDCVFAQYLFPKPGINCFSVAEGQ